MRTIAALIFPGFELLDLFGPLEMFGLMKSDYKVQLVAEKGGLIASNQGAKVQADRSLSASSDYDILFVPGGSGTRQEVFNQPLLEWIAATSAKAEYTLSVCTGSALLAKAGVLDNRRATTNKLAYAWATSQGPHVQWVKQARWVEDGALLTSSGVSAGMDMTLGAIALMHGRDQATKVARYCEYTWHEDKDDDPFAKLNGLV